MDDDRADQSLHAEQFKEAMSHWAATVTVVSVRHGGQVHAMTVSSFIPVSAEPPMILVSLGANARVLPWLTPGASFTVSFLAEDQRRLASVFADSYPVGPSPFPDEGDPVVLGAVASLVCSVYELFETGSDARLVVGRVKSAEVTPDNDPLLYYRRRYRELDDKD